VVYYFNISNVLFFLEYLNYVNSFFQLNNNNVCLSIIDTMILFAEGVYKIIV